MKWRPPIRLQTLIISRSVHNLRFTGTDYDLTLKDRLRSISGLPVVHSEGYVCGLPANHRFQMKKFRELYNILVRDKVVDPKKQVLSPPQITADLAALAHTKEYVDRFLEGKTTETEQRRTGFKWTHGLASRVRYETGGTLLSALVSLERGLCSSTGGGTHHAGPDYGSGYCLINDLAVTASCLLNLGLVSRVLIIDLDVHQGDGTALIFEDNPQVFTFSLHCQSNFPFRKTKSDLDIGLENHTSDTEYLRVVDDTVPHLLDTFRPDLVLYDAGVDPHVLDDLGKLDVTDQGLWRRDQLVLNHCVDRGIPVTTVIGGGYDKDLTTLAARHGIVHRVCTNIYRERFSAL